MSSISVKKVTTKKRFIIIALAVLLLGGAAAGIAVNYRKTGELPGPLEKLNPAGDQSEAIKSGKQLSNGRCEGEGVPYKLSSPPMNPADFSIIIPYGLMVGGHVTPIDHQYFSPTIFRSEPDKYPVYAMADARLVHIEKHQTRIRMIFAVTCTYLYYYDLVTSLAPDIQKAYDQAPGGSGVSKAVNVEVKAGQEIGRIGGQTLDFAVWDTTKPLKGFIVPEHYRAESWKLYTADPLEYYTDELKTTMLSKYVRTVEPVSGKIDYDVDGKLIGNWFLEGTDYGGKISSKQGHDPDSYRGHLSIAPDLYDPAGTIVSIGYLVSKDGGRGGQYSADRTDPDPGKVGQETGLVKYSLKGWSYRTSNGTFWDRMSFTRGLTLDNANSSVDGCAIAQLLESRKLKFETFMNTVCSQVSGFSSAAKVYTR